MDSAHYHYVAREIACGTRKAKGGKARPLPKRGNIKKQIFASIAASILALLKRMGANLLEIIHYALEASSGKICSAGKATSTAFALDLLGAIRP